MRWTKKTALPRVATARASLFTTALLVLPRNVSRSSRLLLSVGLALLLGSTGEAQEVRFEACTDGLTVADNATGLLWERKVGNPDDPPIFCETVTGDCLDPHYVNNRYQWSSEGAAPNGNAYLDFLVSLNAGFGFAGHTDWRLPKVSELQTILIGPGVGTPSTNLDPADPAAGTNPTGQSSACPGAPCIDPGFTAIDGSTPATPNFDYWTEASRADNPLGAYVVSIGTGNVGPVLKTSFKPVRAVRAGSCPPTGTGNIRLIEGSLVPAAALVLANPSETLRLERGLLGQLGAGRSSGASGVVLTGGVLPVPEPGAVLLWAAGLFGLLALRRLRPVSVESEFADISQIADAARQGKPS